MSPLQLNHASLADIPEDELVKVLLANGYWRSRLIDYYGIPEDGAIKQRVPLDTAPGGHFKGDIDILLRAIGHPEQAVAYADQIRDVTATQGKTEQAEGAREGKATSKSVSEGWLLESVPLRLHCR